MLVKTLKSNYLKMIWVWGIQYWVFSGVQMYSMGSIISTTQYTIYISILLWNAKRIFHLKGKMKRKAKKNGIDEEKKNEKNIEFIDRFGWSYLRFSYFIIFFLLRKLESLQMAFHPEIDIIPNLIYSDQFNLSVWKLKSWNALKKKEYSTTTISIFILECWRIEHWTFMVIN